MVFTIKASIFFCIVHRCAFVFIPACADLIMSLCVNTHSMCGCVCRCGVG